MAANNKAPTKTEVRDMLVRESERLAKDPSKALTKAQAKLAMEALESRCNDYDEAAIRQLLDELLPEYSPPATFEPPSNVVSLDKAKG